MRETISAEHPPESECCKGIAGTADGKQSCLIGSAMGSIAASRGSTPAFATANGGPTGSVSLVELLEEDLWLRLSDVKLSEKSAKLSSIDPKGSSARANALPRRDRLVMTAPPTPSPMQLAAAGASAPGASAPGEAAGGGVTSRLEIRSPPRQSIRLSTCSVDMTGPCCSPLAQASAGQVGG